MDHRVGQSDKLSHIVACPGDYLTRAHYAVPFWSVGRGMFELDALLHPPLVKSSYLSTGPSPPWR
ncbi:hypothetical protein [Bradyrhizobium australafricanum]|uniref:hypothetical protein n=1 Tax=Bradyrhizobium australafricanum TaxID=2821406 RepID=UPI001CE385B7|nr:hypothetical protein [Bradyrhizobium australafricanum]MCA6104534.1 hypothetical protein [Bradyrhizobium australafricanum]